MFSININIASAPMNGRKANYFCVTLYSFYGALETHSLVTTKWVCFWIIVSENVSTLCALLCLNNCRGFQSRHFHQESTNIILASSQILQIQTNSFYDNTTDVLWHLCCTTNLDLLRNDSYLPLTSKILLISLQQKIKRCIHFIIIWRQKVSYFANYLEFLCQWDTRHILCTSYFTLIFKCQQFSSSRNKIFINEKFQIWFKE